ncbi:DUF2812 domain-containing protein [Bacillus sp. ISL-35]|uniref:DUF2812 domain-containing protein n=1 Tax=Bacillus sp. ISL-35 TaxID=2819122 RepID=UPI001BE6A861|nr:DUF2812 domain-containing protein [Bacillus sp. ISL-35]MBT2679328.1 DUF2812 domain-containing protein [Bacillus sp. ISL-35]MBT2703227.1 DUF2812 domain-containing protein [Chryseobacterium sp. ISL-80]
MTRPVYKIRPSVYWRIGEHECWFADMAAQGLFLKKMGIHFARFEKGEPRRMKYRIYVTEKKKIPAEQIEIYAESGWNFLTSYGNFHVFSSPEELNAPELHPDPAEQAYLLRGLDKKLAWNAIGVIVCLVLIIGMMASIWFLDGTPAFAMVEGAAIQQMILMLFIAYTAYHSLRAAFSIRTLRKKLAEGKPIDHRAPWKKKHRTHTTAAFLFTVLAGASAVIPFMQLVKMDTKTLPETSLDLPIVRLAEVEQNPDLVRSEIVYMSDNVDWGNRYSYKWSPLAPVQYETDESGQVPGKLWDDKSGEYSPAIHTQFYKLTFENMADELVSDLIKRYKYENTQDEYRKKNHPDLDLLVVHVEKDKKEVFASRGNVVMYVRYHGDAELGTVIEKVVEKTRLLPD